jgi:hypothetical protein
VSVENQRHGLPRIEDLRRVPAAVRFLSIEPLLEDLGAERVTAPVPSQRVRLDLIDDFAPMVMK